MDVHLSSSVRALQKNWEIQRAMMVRESEIDPSSEISDVHRRAEKDIGGGSIVRHVIKSGCMRRIGNSDSRGGYCRPNSVAMNVNIVVEVGYSLA